MYVFSTDKQLVETSQESFIMHLKQKNYELLLPRRFLILFLPSQATTVYTRYASILTMSCFVCNHFLG